MKIIVFDLGGTLMQYVGMPLSWVDFYHKGFETVNDKYNCKISSNLIDEAVQILKEFNPRVNYREIEHSAEYIFSKALEQWHIDIPIENSIETFWRGLKLRAEIYPDVIEVLKALKEKGYVIATLTDLPNAMPDEFFKRDIAELLIHIDYYVSSSVAGYRKPNCKGLQLISDKYNVLISDLIFVGDEEKDRSTANNARCKFIKVDRTKCDDKSICNLYELLNIVD